MDVSSSAELVEVMGQGVNECGVDDEQPARRAGK
jgi:hypothetical protein